MKESQLGNKLTPILVEIENTLWEHEAEELGAPNFPIEGFRASIKIFMSIFLDKMYSLSKEEGIPLESASAMATKVGEDIRKLVKVYTNIDTHDLYDEIK